MKIYTKTGDGGTTALIGGERVAKYDPRVEAYGSVDELTAFIALLADKLVEQVLSHGVNIELEEAVGIEDNGEYKTVITDTGKHDCRAVIIATGAHHRHLGIEGEDRFEGEGIFCNSAMNSRMMDKYCRLSNDCKALLKKLIDKMGLSARACSRIIKLSRTIADLEGSEIIRAPHIAEAIQLRSLDRKYWN